ncbi:MAG: cytochrome c oxidase subunit II [Myxococcota bacterium]
MNPTLRSFLRRVRLPLFGLVATGLALAARYAHAAVQPEGGLGLPRDVSHDGHLIDWLINVTHVFNIILFVIMCVWMAVACFKHNAHHEAEYDHGESKRSVTIALCLSAFIFAVVDGNLFVNTIIGLDKAFWNFSIPQNDANTVRIEVNAHQWAWDGRYAGEDKRFSTPAAPSPDDILTWNELHVPVDTPVHLQLTATDVIHSFYLPNFRVKMDAVPGQVNQLWFRAKEPGEFDIGCAQHCGTHHYKMKAKLIVHSQEDYRRWEHEAGINGKRAFDPEDTSAHWGWAWKEQQ